MAQRAIELGIINEADLQPGAPAAEQDTGYRPEPAGDDAAGGASGVRAAETSDAGSQPDPGEGRAPRPAGPDDPVAPRDGDAGARDDGDGVEPRTERTDQGDNFVLGDEIAPEITDDSRRQARQDAARRDGENEARVRQQQSKIRRGGQESVEGLGLFDTQGDLLNRPDRQLTAAPTEESRSASMYLQVEGRRFPVGSIEEASQKYQAVRDQFGEGGSNTPPVTIVDPAGRELYRISNNGRVWPNLGRDWEPGDKPVFDPGEQSTAKQIRAADRSSASERTPAQETTETPAPEAGVSDSGPVEPSTIEDFGEKIEGARKDTWTKLTAALSDDIDVSAEPLSKSFPRPNYEKLAEEGVSIEALALVAVMREQIPTKPRRGYKLSRWVEQVEMMRRFADNVLKGDSSPANVKRMMRSPEYMRSLQNIAHTADVIQDLPASALEWAAKFRVEAGSYSMLNAIYYSPSKTFFRLATPKGVGAMRRDDGVTSHVGHYETLEEITGPAREFIQSTMQTKGEGENQKTKRLTPIQLYKDRNDGSIFIGFKGRTGVIRLKARFDDPKAAREYRDEHRDEIQAEIDKMRTDPALRRAENRTRKGPERREGDVSPDISRGKGASGS
jgi:hypothetical protein